VVVELECGITVYPARAEDGRWRAVWHEDGQRQQCEAPSEEKLAAQLEKVKIRLEADAPNMRQPGAALLAHYLDPPPRRGRATGSAAWFRRGASRYWASSPRSIVRYSAGVASGRYGPPTNWTIRPASAERRGGRLGGICPLPGICGWLG
jgi:hypothetical protein